MSEVTSVNGKIGAVVLKAADVEAVATSEVGQPSGVASLNGSGELPEAQLPNSVISGSQLYVNVLNYGAVSGTDCTAAIKAAIAEAEKLPGNYGLFFPAGEWLFSETLLLSVPWRGVPGKTTLKNLAGFTYGHYESKWCIVNPHAGSTYNSATADTISIVDINFETEGNSGGSQGFLGLANVAKGEIWNCSFRTVGSNYRDSLIDNFACVKNMRYLVRVENLTEKQHGGCMWIRNRSSKPEEAVNSTENIWVAPTSYFGQTTEDEALAVFGSLGVTKNILIDHAILNGLASSQAHNHLASTFPLSESGARVYASVENVEWRGVKIKDVNGTLATGGNLLVFGQSGDEKNATNRTQNLKSVDCEFYVQSTNTGVNVLRYVGDSFEGGFAGVKAINPYINCVGSTAVIESGVRGFPCVEGGTTTGSQMSAACRNCNKVTGGEWEASSKVFFDCISVGGDWKVTIPNETGNLFYRESAIASNASYGKGECTGGKSLLIVHSTVTSASTITVAGVTMATTAESGNLAEVGTEASVNLKGNVVTGPKTLSITGVPTTRTGNVLYGEPDPGTVMKTGTLALSSGKATLKSVFVKTTSIILLTGQGATLANDIPVVKELKAEEALIEATSGTGSATVNYAILHP